MKIQDVKKDNIKYFCKFDIQIETSDLDFNVTRRILGAKGCNMKRIIELCNKQNGFYKNFEKDTSEVIKLKLRGRGSNA